MTNVELLRLLSLISFIVAGAFLLITLAVFFLLDIMKVIGDLTGSTAKKAIESIRQQNEESGDKAYKPSKENIKRGKLTDKITPSGHLQINDYSSGGVAVATEKLQGLPYDNPADATTILNNEETTILDVNNETAILNTGNETTILNSNNETTVLNNTQETTILSDDDTNNDFEINYEIEFIGSDEIIE